MSIKKSIIQDLLWRYTTKKYNGNKKIPKDDLDIFYESLRLSASSINSQPWRFVVLDSNEAKNRFTKIFAKKHQFNLVHIDGAFQIILFAYNPRYTKDDYAKVVDQAIEDGRMDAKKREKAFGSFIFAELNTDTQGYNGCWTKAQLYIALGNALHTLARLKIDSTPLEGIDIEVVNREFEKELDGYQCDVALAIGYRDEKEDFNAKLPKSRKDIKDIIIHI